MVLAGVLSAFGPAATAQADDNTFGGAEVAYTHDSNFSASPADVPLSPDSSTVYFGYLAHYWPSQDLRNAVLVRAEGALVRQRTFTAFDSTDYGASLGLYHAFSTRNVLTASAGLLVRHFSDSSFDSHTRSAQATLKHKLTATVSLREYLTVESSRVSTADFSNRGWSIGTSATWAPVRRSQVSLNLSWWGRTYDGAPGADRSGKQAGVAALRQLGEALYVRVSIARQRNETLAGVGYKNTNYSFALGLDM
ncbi:MAG TPA: hypothetical protein VFB20_16725 [Burkholderiales bacterium]|nr:hypothetical protein [Burkholderiales bacterium]